MEVVDFERLISGRPMYVLPVFCVLKCCGRPSWSVNLAAVRKLPFFYVKWGVLKK